MLLPIVQYRRLFSYEPPPPPEPTNEARIRDAALRCLANNGIAATSMRTVAETAAVSIGLVQHYFRTKSALIAAVDQHVLQVVGNALDAAPLPDPPGDALNEAGRRLTALMAEQSDVITYLGRALAEGGQIGTVIFEGLIGISATQRDQFIEAGMTRPDLDRDWAALNPLILRVGAIILRPHIERYLKEALLTTQQLQRWDDAVTGLIREGLFHDESGGEPTNVSS
jgi:AcrR family transcriptional regulator